MKDLITSNPALFAGILVAALSFLSSFLNFLKDRNFDAKSIKTANDYIEIFNKLPENMLAKHNFERIINELSERILHQHSLKVNKKYIGVTVFLALVGGLISYLFASWASQAVGFWSVLLWIICVSSALITILISIAGYATRFKDNSKHSDYSKHSNYSDN